MPALILSTLTAQHFPLAFLPRATLQGALLSSLAMLVLPFTLPLLRSDTLEQRSLPSIHSHSTPDLELEQDQRYSHHFVTHGCKRKDSAKFLSTYMDVGSLDGVPGLPPGSGRVADRIRRLEEQNDAAQASLLASTTKKRPRTMAGTSTDGRAGPQAPLPVVYPLHYKRFVRRTKSNRPETPLYRSQPVESGETRCMHRSPGDRYRCSTTRQHLPLWRR